MFINGILHKDICHIILFTVDFNTACIDSKTLQLIVQLIPGNRRIALYRQLGSAGEINAPVQNTIALHALKCHTSHTDDKHRHRSDDKVFRIFNKIKILEEAEIEALLPLAHIRNMSLLHAEPAQLVIQPTAANQKRKQEFCDEDNQDDSRNRRYDQHGRKALHTSRTHHIQNQRTDKGCDLRIENRNKGLGASLIKGGLYTTSGIQRVLDTLKCQNVGIGRHTDTKHEGRNTRQGKDCAHGIIDEEHDKDIGCQRDCGNQTRQTVVQNHEQHDQCDTDTASQHGFTEGVDTVIGSHRIAVFLTHFHRQRTGVDQILQLGCLLLGEASANLRTGGIDPLTHRCSRNEFWIFLILFLGIGIGIRIKIQPGNHQIAAASHLGNLLCYFIKLLLIRQLQADNRLAVIVVHHTGSAFLQNGGIHQQVVIHIAECQIGS